MWDMRPVTVDGGHSVCLNGALKYRESVYWDGGHSVGIKPPNVSVKKTVVIVWALNHR